MSSSVIFKEGTRTAPIDIPGKLRKRMWIREGDLLIVAPWEFQNDKSDIRWRYTKTQAVALSRRKLLPKTVDIF